ncbi:MAG: hypothetical protein ACKVHU_00020 [Acidimicrobiales bacterium]
MGPGPGQSVSISDELADFAVNAFTSLTPAHSRTEGGGFKAAIGLGDNPSALDRMLGFTGRQG